MLKFLPALAVLVASAPVAAQSPQPAPEATAQPKMVKKVVCKRIPADQVSGSRLSSTSKVCREVEVPADEAKQSASDRHSH